MKAFKIYPFLFFAAVGFIMLPTSCSKTGYTLIQTTTDTATQTVVAADEVNVNYELDQVVNEALLATTISRIASGDSTGTGTSGGLYNTISNVVIDTSHITDSTLIRLTYAGKNADQTKGRSGSVTLQYGVDNLGKIIAWKNQGASITITFAQYEVVILSNNKSLWLNGTATITNTTGGLLKNPAYVAMPTGGLLQDKLSGQVAFTYNDNTTVLLTWAWTFNEARTFSIQNSVLTSSVTGDTTINGAGNISTSGTTRFGDNFYTAVISPIVQSIPSSFLLSNPLSGKKSIDGIKEPITVTYGVDVHGNIVTSGVPYGYLLNWVSGGAQVQNVQSY